MTPEEELAAAKAALTAAEEASNQEQKDLQIDDKNNDPVWLREGLNKANGEAKERRLNEKILKERIQTLEAEKAAAEKKKMEDENDLKGLLELEKKEKREILLNLQTRALNLSIENKLRAEGVDPRYAKMIDKDQFSIDNKGNVDGLDEAIAKFKTDNADLLSSAKPIAKSQKASADKEDDSEESDAHNPMSGIKGKPNPMDGSPFMIDMKKVNSLANGGKNPPEAGSAAAPKPVKVTSLPKTMEGKKEADDAYTKFKQGLRVS